MVDTTQRRLNPWETKGAAVMFGVVHVGVFVPKTSERLIYIWAIDVTIKQCVVTEI